MSLDDSVMKIIMAIPDPCGPAEDPMAPGMHGETEGPSGAADELIRKIHGLCCEYLGANEQEATEAGQEGE